MTLKLLTKPTHVRQTDFNAGKGNALQCCVAALFGLELDDVPNFITLSEGYFSGIEQFVAPRYRVRKCDCVEASAEEDGTLCILRGKSPRGSHGHVVIARIKKTEDTKNTTNQDFFEFVHDPHPEETFLDTNEPFGWYMVFDESAAANSSGSTDNPHALQFSQDANEMFDVMEPPPETFDMYKDRPVPTGRRKARALVHKDGDWHRSAHIWLVDYARQNIGLQKRSPQKDTFPNRWDISSAGHLEAGTSDSRATALQELAEELGIDDIFNPQQELVFAFTCPAEQAPLGGCNCYEDVYILERDSEQCQIKMGAAEVTAFQWIPFQALEEALRSENQDYVPRVGPYLDAFFAHLATAVSKKH